MYTEFQSSRDTSTPSADPAQQAGSGLCLALSLGRCLGGSGWDGGSRGPLLTTHSGFVQRLPPNSFRSQTLQGRQREGRGQFRDAGELEFPSLEGKAGSQLPGDPRGRVPGYPASQPIPRAWFSYVPQILRRDGGRNVGSAVPAHSATPCPTGR